MIWVTPMPQDSVAAVRVTAQAEAAAAVLRAERDALAIDLAAAAEATKGKNKELQAAEQQVVPMVQMCRWVVHFIFLPFSSTGPVKFPHWSSLKQCLSILVVCVSRAVVWRGRLAAHG